MVRTIRRSHFGVFAVLAAVALLCVLVTTSAAAPGSTTRVSVADGSGIQADNTSTWPSISADGRYVVFPSQATNLVPNDTNGVYDVFVRDLQAGTTERVSVDSSGIQQNGETLSEPGATLDDLRWGSPSISADGRFVAFTSSAISLLGRDENKRYIDTNGRRDVFVRDRQTGTTERISVDSSGAQASGGVTGSGNPSGSFGPSISSDGRFVAFTSSTTNLVANDTNGYEDVFVRDRQTGITERVSVNNSGTQTSGSFSSRPSISPDGRFVAFWSAATNLVANDTNNTVDAFVRDRQTGTTERVSVSSSGTQGNQGSGETLSISADGRFVTFVSAATNLVANDTNNTSDVFVRDRQTGTTERVSVNNSGTQANGYTDQSSMSADGRFVAFRSAATNLVPDDTNLGNDVFVRDRQMGITKRVNVDNSGAQGFAYHDGGPSINSDGRIVAFVSGNNLVADDTNNAYDVYVRELDSSLPTVETVVPTEGAPDFSRSDNVIAKFSEPMKATSVNNTTFKLVRNSTTIKAVVSYDTGANKAILDPSTNLQAGTTYTATVTTGATDLEGNPLDQSSTLAGFQPKSWSFTVKR